MFYKKRKICNNLQKSMTFVATICGRNFLKGPNNLIFAIAIAVYKLVFTDILEIYLYLGTHLKSILSGGICV